MNEDLAHLIGRQAAVNAQIAALCAGMLEVLEEARTYVAYCAEDAPDSPAAETLAELDRLVALAKGGMA